MQVKTINIPTFLRIESGALDRIGDDLKKHGLSHAEVYFGDGLIEMFGNRVFESLNRAGIGISGYSEPQSIEMQEIISTAFALDSKVDAVIGIGGGKVIDFAKYVSYLRRTAFISVPTSTSTDGFSSASASLIVDGRRTSVPAEMAFGILIDTDVLRTAPVKFIYSGIGDLASKISAIYDWQFEAEHGVSTVNDVAVMISKKSVNSCVRTPYSHIDDSVFLDELVNSLSMSGLANEIAGSSAPTSGSEHLIGHALDKLLEKPQLHGVQVGIATYLMCLVQNHRYERVNRFFTDTGFWNYVETLEMKKADFEAAIDLAPSIKPGRYTYLHEEKYREAAKKFLYEDEILNRILK